VSAKLGILLNTSPEHQNTYTACQMLESFLKDGHEAELFLMNDGIYNVLKNNSPYRLFGGVEELMEKGLKVSLCLTTGDIRGFAESDFIDGVECRSQDHLADIVASSDYFLHFG
jgi:sulfur relay (sulfurtransferase) complex TusBCD TusD component (DsrE family)